MTTIAEPFIGKPMHHRLSKILRIHSESESFLSGEDTIDPAFLICACGIKGGECLGQAPEALVAADAIFDKETLHRFGATGSE